ncbi:hypothetical protein EG68_06071 [Paragonimus skrjabini miyazakii]|uniref:CUB domain-containing protein n=1 Tax=Paragonimus skrjabini miyazakii TaxID=59628 RepID=A0A8S9YV33_9TREM|nr:hypothetical protein EG68_06071 [Paragonimus skrjabini miyazakii]
MLVKKLYSGCNVTLSGSNGNFTSPGYPGRYPSNTICFWEIKVDPGKRIHLLFDPINLPGPSEYMPSDNILLYDGPTCTAPVAGMVLSSERKHFFSSSNQMAIMFISYSYLNEVHNFFASYTAEEPDTSVKESTFIPQFCGANYTTATGSISFFDAADRPCSWMIEVEEGHVIFLNIFYIVTSSIGRYGIYDGNSCLMNTTHSYGGHLLSGADVFKSSGNRLTLLTDRAAFNATYVSD